LLIVSTDFTHYGPQYDHIPGISRREILAVETKMVDKMLTQLRFVPNPLVNACGPYALDALMFLLQACFPNVKGHAETHSFSSKRGANFVSYWGLQWTEDWYAIVARVPRLLLLRSEALVKLLHIPPLNERSHLGVFVTLRERGALRGCLGTFWTHHKPVLIERIIQETLLTVYKDARFSDEEVPLRTDPKLANHYSFEVSLLGPGKHVSWKDLPHEYDPCRKGIILSLGGRSATFLSSVAVENKWVSHCGPQRVPEILLAELVRKMGFSDEDPRKGRVELYSMTSFVDRHV
jgi:AMMECR1 domain-containing protein